MKKKLSAEEEENENNKWIQGKMKKTRKKPFTIEKTRGVYDMSSKIRGWCLIFSNHVFKHLNKLVGYERDKDNFEGVFNDLGFNVKIFEKVTADEIKSNIQRYANKSASDGSHPTNALVVVILSHGSGDYLCGVNYSETNPGDKISVDEVMDIVSNRNCPHLIGKPKIFVLQACRGSKIDFGISKDLSVKVKNEDIKPTPMATTLRSGKKFHHDELDEIISTLPSVVEDMMVFYATSPDHTSYVPLTGSIFGVQLCVHLKRYAWQRDLHDIMLSVSNALRSKDITIDDKNCGKQVLEIKYISPTKKLYFNPGYFKSNSLSSAPSTSASSTSVASTSAASTSAASTFTVNVHLTENLALSDQSNGNILIDENAEPDRKRKPMASRNWPIYKGITLGKGQTKLDKYFKKQKTSDSNHPLASAVKHH